MSNNNAKIIGALLVGAALGVTLGLLLAPEKGAETQEKVKEKAEDLAHEAEDEIKEVVDVLKQKANEMGSILSKSFEEAKKLVEETAHHLKNNVTQ